MSIFGKNKEGNPLKEKGKLTPEKEAIRILRRGKNEKFEEYRKEMIKLIKEGNFDDSNKKTCSISPKKHFERELRGYRDQLENLRNTENPNEKIIKNHEEKIEELKRILEYMGSEKEEK